MNSQTLIRFIAITCVATAAYAQDDARQAPVPPLQYSPAQLADLGSKLLRLKQGEKVEVPAAEADRGVFVISEGTHIGSTSLGRIGASPYAICSLRFANLTKEPVEFAPSLSLMVDGREVMHGPLTSSWSSQTFVGGRRLPNMLPVPENMHLEPGEVTEVHATFPALPDVTRIERLALIVNGLVQPVRQDLMAQAVAQLGLQTRQTGPRKCLGVVTIERRLGSVNAHYLAGEIDRLAQAGASRILIRWGKSAVIPPASTRTWLREAAQKAAIVFRNPNGHPSMPGDILELHIGPFPGSRSSNYPRQSLTHRTYNDNTEAFIQSLMTAYQRIPATEIVKDIEQSDPLLQVAAIRGGVGRLPDRLVPTLLELADSEDASASHAAITALAAFSSETAVRRVAKAAQSEDEDLAKAAVTGLRDSRFPIAQQILTELVQSLEGKTRDRMASLLTLEPQVAWADLYYEYASAGQPNRALPAIRAVAQVGHPELTELWGRLLTSKSPSIRKEVFKLLSASQDQANIDVALSHTIDQIKENMPSREMLTLLTKFGADPQIKDILIGHYRKTKDRTLKDLLLSAITSVGDESIVAFLLEELTSDEAALSTTQKSRILSALQMFNPPELKTFALAALKTNNINQVTAACDILREDASPEVVYAIGDALVSTKPVTNLDNIARLLIQTLRGIATPEARRFLRVVQNGESEARRLEASRRLLELQRSSANLLQAKAKELVDRKKLVEAEEVFATAIEIDSQNPEIYISRGHMKSHSDRRAEGIKDFDKALAIDPLHPIATSLKAIARVVLGDIDGGLEMIEDNRDTFKWDSTFNYNAACAYGQAVKNTKPTPDNLKQIAEWRTRAVFYLNHCVTNLEFGGSRIPAARTADQELLRSDPDLDPLRDMEEFREIEKRIGTPPGDKKKIKDEDDG